MMQCSEIAWDITEWDRDADLSYGNIMYNLISTFIENSLVCPRSIVCRPDQRRVLGQANMLDYAPGSFSVESLMTQFGPLQIKVIPPRKVQRVIA